VSGVMHYYHGDSLGSTSLITDSNGNLVERSSYFPFGLSLEGGKVSPYGFTGQEQDTIGLYYYGSRYYDPFLGQFLQPDSMLPDIYDPQQLNRYSYARNNPLKYTDPDGHEPLTITAVVLAVLFIVDIAWNVYDYYRDSRTLADPDASDIDKQVAAFGLTINAAGELAEPDQAAGVSLPLDDIARRKAQKEFRKQLESKMKKKGGDFFEKGKPFDISRNIDPKSTFIRELPDGRIRQYDSLVKPDKPGPTFGRRNVKEIDPFTGQTKRDWQETYDALGRTTQVHPKFPEELPHYRFDPETGKLVESWYKDPITKETIRTYP